VGGRAEREVQQADAGGRRNDGRMNEPSMCEVVRVLEQLRADGSLNSISSNELVSKELHKPAL